MILIRQVKKI